jgi:anti-sigma regulatory factor (Ser/Thr protein kinase)
MWPAEIMRLRLRCDVAAPRIARRALEDLEAISPVHDDALLVASELATSAVLSANGDPAKEIELLAELVPDGLRITLVDPSPDRAPRAVEPPGASTIAQRIIRGIARRWGMDRTDGEQVWAVLAM